MTDIPTFDVRDLVAKEVVEIVDQMVPVVEHPVVRDSPVYMHRGFASEGLGTEVRGITHVKAALQKAGLDYKIKQVPAWFGPEGKVIGAPRRLANVREDTNEFIEYVSNRYTPFQNEQAYAFLEGMLDSGALQLERAGQFDYNSVFIEARTPETLEILGDQFIPFSLIKNSHDGNGSVTVCFTYTRIACKNTLALAVASAPRIWRARHLRTVEDRMQEAQEMLGISKKYQQEYVPMAKKLHEINLTEDNIVTVLKKVFPLKKDAGVGAIKTASEQAREILQIYNNTPDLKKFHGTAWGFYNAIGDFTTHTRPRKETQNWKANRLDRIALGHPMMETAQAALLAIPA